MAYGLSEINQNGVDYRLNDPNITNEFSTSTAYAVGEYVNYNGLLYKFTTAHPEGAWDSSHVTEVKVVDEIGDLDDKITEEVTDLKSAVNQQIYRNLMGSGTSKYPVEILPGTKLTVSTENGEDFRSGTLLKYFDADQTQIGYSSLSGSSITLTTPTSGGIICFLQFSQSPNNNIMVNVGTIAFPYKEYVEPEQGQINTIVNNIQHLTKWAALVPYNSQYQIPSLQFNTTNKTVTIKRSFILADVYKQYAMSDDTTISYDVSGTTNAYIVFDIDDSTIKAVPRNSFVASHQLIIAVLDKSYVAYTYQVDTINSYSVDGVFYPLNKALEQSPGSNTKTAISQDGTTKCFGVKYTVLLPAQDKYAIYIDKTNNKFIIKKSYVFEKTGRRQDISSEMEVSATLSPSTISTKYLVYDEANHTIKVVESKTSGNNKFDQKTHSIILTFGGDNGLDNVTSLTPYTYIGGSVSDDEPVKITVCNYNVGLYNYGVSGSPVLSEISPKINSAINSINADLLGIEEGIATIGGSSVDTATYANIYKHIYAPSGTSYSIKSKYAFQSYEKTQFSTGNNLLHCVCTIGGRNVDIFCTDLAATTSNRTTERGELITLLSGCDYAIALIDANAGNNDVATTQTEYNDFITAGLNTANGGYVGLITTYPGENPRQLDTIVTTSNIVISDIHSINIYSDMVSDHIPLVCQLTIY